MPFLLTVFIDTDDDAAIEFQGKAYCFYSDDLQISKSFNTPEECYAFLRNEIKIKPGMKVSECLHQWIEEFITYHKVGADWYGIHGNQTVEINIDEVAEVDAVPASIEVSRTCKTCKFWDDGTCDLVGHWKGPQSEPATLFELDVSADDDSNLQASLRTGPDFGCILHISRS